MPSPEPGQCWGIVRRRGRDIHHFIPPWGVLGLSLSRVGGSAKIPGSRGNSRRVIRPAPAQALPDPGPGPGLGQAGYARGSQGVGGWNPLTSPYDTRIVTLGMTGENTG